MNNVTEQTLKPIQEMLDRMKADAVFGAPTTENGNTIIPAAHIAYGFGFGFGGQESETVAAPENAGSGGGGGGGAWATPMGYIHISPDGVTYRGTPNETLLGLAGIFVAIWAIFWGMLTVRSVARVFRKD